MKTRSSPSRSAASRTGLRARDDQRAHVRCDMTAADDAGSFAQVGQSRVRAGSDEGNVDARALTAPGGEPHEVERFADAGAVRTVGSRRTGSGSST